MTAIENAKRLSALKGKTLAAALAKLDPLSRAKAVQAGSELRRSETIAALDANIDAEKIEAWKEIDCGECFVELTRAEARELLKTTKKIDDVYETLRGHVTNDQTATHFLWQSKTILHLAGDKYEHDAQASEPAPTAKPAKK